MLDLLKDMKKIKEDAKTVTMQHPSGHTMVIVVKKLPAVQKEALKRLKLYDGGEIKGVHKASPESPDRPGRSKVGWMQRAKSEETPAMNKSLDKYSKEEHQAKLDELKSMPNPKLKGLAKGGVAHYADDDSDSGDSGNNVVKSDDAKPPVTVNVNQAPQSAAAQQAQTNVPVQQPNIQETNPPVNLPNGSMSAPGAAQTAQEAATGQAQIDTAKANAMVPVEEARIKAQQNLAQQEQDRIDALSKHADNLAANIKNINPNAAWDNMSEPKKIVTGLGLFLGGFGVGFHGQNFAQDMLNRSLDRDVQAQIQNNENQKTIFNAYNTLYGNQAVASKMARASMADIYSDQASQIAAKLGTPQALVNLQKIKSDLAISKNKDIRDASFNLSNSQNMPSGQYSGVQPATGQSGNGENKNNGIQNIDYKILKPGAEGQISNLLNPQYHPEIGETDRAEIAAQMSAASQAEKGLQDLRQTFTDLANEGNRAGISGRIHRTLSPHALAGVGAGIGALAGAPGVGAGIGEAVGQGAGMLTNTEMNRRFDSDKSKMAGILSSALPGRGDTFFQKILDENTPEYGDELPTLQKKLAHIREFITQHTTTDALKRHGLSYK